MATTEQPPRNIGARKLRKEDPELITGAARYTDNITVPGMLWLGFVRSPFAHARYTKADVSKALAMDGVVAAYTAADLEFAAPLFMAFPLRRSQAAAPLAAGEGQGPLRRRPGGGRGRGVARPRQGRARGGRRSTGSRCRP